MPWYEWRRFLSCIESPARVLAAHPPVLVLWNAVMGPLLRRRSRGEILGGKMLVSRLLRIGLGLSTVVAESRGSARLDLLSRLRFSWPGRSVEVHGRRLLTGRDDLAAPRSGTY